MKHSRSRVLRRLLIGSTSVAALGAFLHAPAAAGGPTGSTVVAGQATITTPSSTSTVIKQSTEKAIINWQDFSISAGSTTTFQQPNSLAITLNRVIGSGASVIDGNLFANGRIWIINGNGILFGKGSQINVGSLIATTSDIANNDFLSGNYSFGSASGNPNASVVNRGTIKAASGGSIVLAGPVVSNAGLIEADLGTVVLGGADTFTVDFQGDSLIQFAITTPVSNTPIDANGKPQAALVSNSGTVSAAGGKILMTARAAQSVADNVINNTGIVEATSVHQENGTIVFDGGADGEVDIGGTVDASGKGSGETGGAITVTAGTVNVADGAKLDASGDSGGGTISIGGNLHGQGPLANAQTATVGNAVISADAIRKGNGGTVVVWSNGATDFSGHISAKGGAHGGNGGLVETSGGKLQVGSAATVDTQAPQGLTGTWLLDPANIIVSSGGETGLTGGTLGTGTDPGATDTIDPSTIIAALATTNVTLEASNDIQVLSNLVYSSANSLNLLAEHSIDIYANVQNTLASGGGAINLIAGWNGTALSALSLASPDFFGNDGGSVVIGGTSASQSVAVGSASGNTAVAGADVTLTAVNGYAQIGYHGAGGGGIEVLATGDVTLTAKGSSSTQAQIGNGGTSVAGNVGGAINVNAGGDITIDAKTNANTAAIGNISGDSSSSQSGAITVTAGGALDITSEGGGALAYLGNWSKTITTGGATGDITVVAGALVLGAHGHSQSIIGDGGVFTNSGTTGGNIKINAGSISIVADEGHSASSQARIANRGLGDVSGNIDVVSDGDIELLAADTNLAAIGNGEGGTGVTSGHINVQSGGGISLLAQDSGNSRISSGAAPDTDIDVTAAGDIVLSVTSTPENLDTGGAVFIGNFSNNVTALGGDITVTSTHGSITLDAAVDDSFVLIGNASGENGTSGDVFVTAGNGLDMSATGDSSFAQIGNGFGSGGDVSGNVTLAVTGDLALLSNNGGFTQIGNGDLTGQSADLGNASGDIVLNVSGATTFDVDAGTVWIGNVAGADKIESGDVTIVTQNIHDQSDCEEDCTNLFGDMIHADLGSTASPGSGGDVTVALTGPASEDVDSGIQFDHASAYDSPHALTLITDLDMEFDASLQNQGTGAITLIAGWNPNASGVTRDDIISAVSTSGGASLAQLFATTPGAYGNNNEGVLIGGGDAKGNVAVGSKGGTTTVMGADVTVEGINGYAQIGFAGGGGTGDITVDATHAVALTANTDEGDGLYAQIGNGGLEADGGDNGGDITVNAGGDITLTGGYGVFSFAQIGNGGDSSSDSDSGDIIVNSGGSVALIGHGDYASIGNGGYGSNGTDSGDITVTATGDIALTGAQTYGYTQIGNGGQSSSSIDSGDIDVTAGGTLTLTSGGSIDYAQIGNGDGDASQSGSVTGDIVVHVTGSATLDSDAGGIVWVGNRTGAGGSHSGDVTLVSDSLDGSSLGAMIGEDLGTTADSGGNVTIGMTGANDITFDADVFYSSFHTLALLSAQNIVFDGSLQNAGTGAIDLVAGWDATTLDPSAFTHAGVFGHNGGSVLIGGSDAHGDVAVGSAGGTVTIAAARLGVDAVNGFAQLGYHGAGGGDIHVVLSSDLYLIGGDSVGLNGGGGDNAANVSEEGSDVHFAQIGNGSFAGDVAANVTGNIDLRVGGITYLAGSAAGQPWIGNVAGTGFAETGNVMLITGDIDDNHNSGNNEDGGDGNNVNFDQMIEADIVGGDLTIGFTNPEGIIGPNHDITLASSHTFNLLSTGDIGFEGSVQNTGTGAINIVAGWDATTLDPSAFTHSGVFGNNDGSVFIGGPGAIGDISVGSAGGTTTIAAASLTIEADAGYAQLGYHGASGGDIDVTLLDSLDLTGTSGADYAQIGNGTAFGSNISGGDVSISANSIAPTANSDLVGDTANIVILSDGTDGGGLGSADAALDVTLNGLALTSTGASAFIASPSHGLSIGVGEHGVNLGNGNLTLSAGGLIGQTAAIVAHSLNVSTTSGAIGLTNSANTFATLTVSTAGTDNATVADSTALTIAGATVGGDLTLTSGGAIGQTGAIGVHGLDVSSTGGAIDLTNTGNVFAQLTVGTQATNDAAIFDVANVTILGADVGGKLTLTDVGSIGQSGAIAAHALDLSAQNGAIVLTNTGNTFATLALATVGSNDASVFDSASLTIAGAAVGGTFTLSSGGAIGQTGTIVAHALNVSTANGAIALTNAANAFGILTLAATGNATVYDSTSLAVAGAAVGGNLTLLTMGNLNFVSSVQLQTGTILAVAGWDGTTTDSSLVVAGSAFGNNGGGVTIGGDGASGGVAVGSASGATTIAGASLTLGANNGYAQLGYHGAGSGALTVDVSGAVALTGGSATGYYAQIGNGGYLTSGSNAGDIAITAGGDVTLTGGTGTEAYAQIGHGGAESNTSSAGYSNTGAVTISGADVILAAGTGTASYAQIGHGGYKSGFGLTGTAVDSGDLTVTAAHTVSLTGNGADAYAQIGNGGDQVNANAGADAHGTISGDIAVHAPNGAAGSVTLTAGLGADAYVQIGNGGYGADASAVAIPANFLIQGNVSVSDLALKGGGPNGFAQIGNGDASLASLGDISGDITIDAFGNVTTTDGTAPGSHATIGNATGNGTTSGTITGYTNTPAANDPATTGVLATLAGGTPPPVPPVDTSGSQDLITTQESNGKQSSGDETAPSDSHTGPLEDLTNNGEGGNDQSSSKSDNAADALGHSLEGSHEATSRMVLGGMLKQTLASAAGAKPHGVPPADTNYASWGNEALWQ